MIFHSLTAACKISSLSGSNMYKSCSSSFTFQNIIFSSGYGTILLTKASQTYRLVQKHLTVETNFNFDDVIAQSLYDDF